MIAVVVMAFSIVMPILPSMLEKMGGAGRDIGLSTAVFSLMQFVFSPIWGKLSDAYGRKPINIKFWDWYQYFCSSWGHSIHRPGW